MTSETWKINKPKTWGEVYTDSQREELLDELVRLATQLVSEAKSAGLRKTIDIFPLRDLDGYEYNSVDRRSVYQLQLVPPGVIKSTARYRWKDGWTEEIETENNEEQVSARNLRKVLARTEVNPGNLERAISLIH